MKNIYLKVGAALSFIVMITVNALANILPINNQTTGGVSDAYGNLFAPAGLTFSIWGLIYLLLLGFVVYQFLAKEKQEELIQKINVYFIISSLANTAWIFAWHYNQIIISVLLMAVILVSLIKIADLLRKEKFSFTEGLFLSAPFSVYFGWITVATIANITVFLVSLTWNGFGIAPYIWTSIILLVGAAIGVTRGIYDKNIAYILVLIWAYIGILIKHTSTLGFANQYPVIIYTVYVCLAIFLATTIFVSQKSLSHK
jgi:hypothetical protein